MKNIDVKVEMPHDSVKEELAAFLICERKQFKIGEPVPVMIGIIYAGTEKHMTFQPPYGPCQPEEFSWFSVTGADGKDVPYTGDYIHLGPNVDPKRAIRLVRARFCGILYRELRWGYKLDTPGSYTIKWHYRIPPTSEGSWWQGHLVSNEIQIKIVP